MIGTVLMALAGTQYQLYLPVVSNYSISSKSLFRHTLIAAPADSEVAAGGILDSTLRG
jgi:hypothetical protein